MAYIYKITNTINQKIYIGKTQESIEKRFKEHCRDSLKERNKKRPLYAAMRKYGIENFCVEMVEETDNPEEREIYWIEYYGSFKNGYNATKGGDGKSYLDYELIFNTYKEVQSVKETASKIGCDKESVIKALQNYNTPILSSAEVNLRKQGQMINQYDLQGKYIQTFPSIKMAAKALNKDGVSHISDVCKGKRKTAYGFIWSYCNK